MKKNQYGFAAAEIFMVVIILAVICVVGIFVYSSDTKHNKGQVKPLTSNSSFSQLTAEASTSSYIAAIQKFITAVQDNNEPVSFLLQSSDLTTLTINASGSVHQSSWYEYCLSEGSACTYYFSKSTLAKAKVTTSSYTSKSLSGKPYQAEEEDFTVPSIKGKGTAILGISAIPSGNSWLINYITIQDPDSASQ